MRILVVEDEPELARTIVQALEEAGFGADMPSTASRRSISVETTSTMP